MKPASSMHRSATALPMSSGVPSRLIGVHPPSCQARVASWMSCGKARKTPPSTTLGGPKTPPGLMPLTEIKAICGAFLTIAAAVSGISYYAAFGALGFIPTGVLLISTILLFRFEHSATFLGPQDGDHDIRNLYSRTGSEKHGREQPDDHKVA